MAKVAETATRARVYSGAAAADWRAAVCLTWALLCYHQVGHLRVPAEHEGRRSGHQPHRRRHGQSEDDTGRPGTGR